MTKTALNSSIQEILTRNGIELSSQLAIDLLGLSDTKKAIRTVLNSPLVGDISYDSTIHSTDDITSLYCIRFNTYLPVSEFSKSTKTNYGYSKESKKGVKLWLHYDKKIKDLEEDILLEKNAVIDEIKTLAEAKVEIEELNTQITKLKELRGSSYSMEQFNNIFGDIKDTKESKDTKEQIKEITEQPTEIVKSFPSKTKKAKESK